MQVFKKICAIVAILAISGCTTAGDLGGGGSSGKGGGGFSSLFGSANNFKVGMLLPLSGAAEKQGQGLKNAALVALDDVKNPDMLLQFYDTKSTPSGARIAIENAINDDSQLIIGPLMAEEVKAISERTLSKDIPMLTFSTNSDVLQPGVYSLGLLAGEQVNRMIEYAAGQGRKYFALLIPDNNTGIATIRAAILSAEKNDVTITRVAFYSPETTDFSDALKGLTDYDRRSGRIKHIREVLQEKVAKGDENATKILNRIKTIETLGDVDFDAIIIPESGSRLKSAVAMLNYYDITAPKVKILGTTMWDGQTLNNEGSMLGGIFPSLAKGDSYSFAGKYSQMFGESPTTLYTLGYDAVSMASNLAKGDHRKLEQNIIRPEGFSGINGAYKIYSDGTNQHILDIMEVRREGNVVVESAPRDLTALKNPALGEIDFNGNYIAPLIFGKNVPLAQTLIYGHPLDKEAAKPAEDEAEITRKSLFEHNIVIQ